MAVYLDTLERLERLRLTRLCPAHGDVIDDPKARIRDYIEHRRAREAQILAIVREQPSKVGDIVARIYGDVDLPAELVDAAGWQVLAHLQTLKRAGRVTGASARSAWSAA
jgi:glyoxylase-like metal-dependent hydrolase (beta-lactamase superfamily II)